MSRNPKIVLLGLLVGMTMGCAPSEEAALDYATLFDLDAPLDLRLSIDNDAYVLLLTDFASCTGERMGFCCEQATGSKSCTPKDLVKAYVKASLWINGQRLDEVGVRILGDANQRKPSLKIRFDHFVPGQRFMGLKRLELHSDPNDPSLSREILASNLFREVGLRTPQTGLAWLETNLGFSGLYTSSEALDGRFLAHAFSENLGNLYQIERGGNLAFRGTDSADYQTNPPLYQKDSNPDPDDRSDLVGLISALDQTQSEDDLDALEAVLDVDETLWWLSVNTTLSNLHSYAGSSDRLGLYRDSRGRFHPIPRKLNKAFGNYRGAACQNSQGEVSADFFLSLDALAPVCGALSSKPLVAKLLGIESLKSRYQAHLKSLLQGPASVESMTQATERLHTLLAPYAEEDTAKGFSTAKFHAAFERDVPWGDVPLPEDPTQLLGPGRVLGLLPFAKARHAALQSQLAD